MAPTLHWLPDQIKHLTTIESLCLRLPSLIELPDWLGDFSLLRQLDLSYCKTLTHLPSTMRDLAPKELNIYRCDQLVPKCAKDGEEWHKISHIPKFCHD
ncbi:hypothetical protein Syun_005895 [Stephania yunnanensis]|uniref:Uncharacterized protein n=1 Tax=Stephania yunnanensis TaxID=152371 RepID=A0AAP0KZ02_9MAGN